MWYGTEAGGWRWLGGIALTPPAASADSGGSINVFVVGGDFAMYSHHWNSPIWSGRHHQGGGFTSNPVIDEFEVFVLGLDELLYRGAIST